MDAAAGRLASVSGAVAFVDDQAQARAERGGFATSFGIFKDQAIAPSIQGTTRVADVAAHACGRNSRTDGDLILPTL